MAVRKSERRRLRNELISRTARVWSRLNRNLVKELNEVAQDWIKKLSQDIEAKFPEKFTKILKRNLREALAYGYWLQHLYLYELRGKKYRGKITLSESDSIKDSLENFMYSGEWNEVIPEDAVKWINNYIPLLAGNFSSDVLEKTRDIIKQSLLDGATLQERMKALQGVLDLSKSRIESIARTEITRADTLGRLTAMKANDDVIGVEFSAIMDDRTTDICASRHGLVMRLDDPRLPENTPPCHVNCRSLLLSLTIYDYPDGLLTSHEFDEIPPGIQRPEDIEEVQKILGNNTDEVFVSGVMDDFTKISGNHSYDEDLAAVNPNYSTGSREWRENCQRCAPTYEARRRGYDVEALPAKITPKADSLSYANIYTGWPSIFENAQLISCASDTVEGTKLKVKTLMKSFGDGARAIIRIGWKTGDGHIFIAEQKDNDTVFLDPQKNKINVDEYFEKAETKDTLLLRIDDKNFTNKIKLCCKNREVNKNDYNVTESNKSS